MCAMLPEVFRDAGVVGNDLARVAWDETSLGPPEHWPRSLRTIVRALLTSRFSMWMAWGPDLTFFCNDAYRRDTLGKKYPWALGRSARAVWAEIWPDIGPRIATVMSTGTATWDEALLLFLERSGYREETYHTFSYSPLTDDGGEIAGMLCVVSEETERVIGARQMATLRDLGSDPTAVLTEDQVVTAAARHLSAARESLPFTLLYRFDDSAAAHLAGAAGFPPEHPAAPMRIDPAAANTAWPVEQLYSGRSVLIDDLPARHPGLPTGAWDEPPAQALVVPLPQQGQAIPFGFLVAGLNRYRPLDDEYRSFIELVAGHVAARIATARAYEQERHRAERLAELDRAKTTFFTNISHEFRTPLTLMLGPTDDALADTDDQLSERHRAQLEIVQRNAQRLLRLVNSLLDFSRLEAGRLTADFEPVDLAKYTAELSSAFETATSRVRLDLTIDCPPLPQPVWVDQEMWAKIVLNLLSNALKFTFAGGITVSLRAEGAAAVLRVTDTGIGVEPEEQRHLFERFHRVGGVRSRTHEGSGIGLALVAELAELHGGSVEVDSTPGHGSTFSVRVPLARAYPSADRPSGAVSPDGESPGAAGAHDLGVESSSVERHAGGFVAEALRWLAASDSSPDGVAEVPAQASGSAVSALPSGAPGEPEDRARVLVVDDNADMRDYVERLLAGAYSVRTVADGLQALEVIRADAPDLVLTDVMMPQMDGFELVAALREDPLTTELPIIMLSARAGEEATVAGLDAGADDYLVKPFSGRELLARVRANLELDRVRRTRAELERSQALLDQAQRLAKVGSWELDLATGSLQASSELRRQMQLSAETLAERGFEYALEERVHPDDRKVIRAAVAAATAGAPMDLEMRVVTPDGGTLAYRVLGELERDETGAPVRLRGSQQDLTEQHQAQAALAAAAAAREAADRETRLANELQASLLPQPTFDPDLLQVATYYRAGVEGTQVGGDWYDVIELGAGRTALVMGDVMGRGVRAAAVMGQLRAAVRAYARLDLPPPDVLEYLDGVVRDLGDDQIVTCIYAVYDPGERRLTYANAGHLPPLLRVPGQATRTLALAAEPPLGAGGPVSRGGTVQLPPGAILALYTDGLVESRTRDIDEGVTMLAQCLDRLDAVAGEAPDELVRKLLPEGPDDDVAILLAQVEVPDSAQSIVIDVRPDGQAVSEVRERVSEILTGWSVPGNTIDDVVLLASELTTNAVVYGRSPIEVRVRRTARHVVLETYDSATFLPRRMRPTPEDEHGRGLQLVALLAERWGTRPTETGKAVWCVVPLVPGEDLIDPVGFAPVLT